MVNRTERVAEIIIQISDLGKELGELEEGPLHAIVMAGVICRIAQDAPTGKLIDALAAPCAQFLMMMRAKVESE